MITLHESHFFLIIILTSILTYIIFSIYQNCDINCKVNYYKYENYHQPKEEFPKIEPSINDTINKEFFTDNVEIQNTVSNITTIGDKSSGHSLSLQGNDINFSDSDAYINKLLNLN